ncbi:virginiamycin B lyase family protein [Skermanella stibiiresistens]|uniref:Vgb family protein n=1 Tax=Skermanella stibiiresistens TaxID=913326 RepID=UPI0004B8D6B1|nr:SMP-30/gluconolactonase/LRE family protein [Skermanella stibiiresistens]
MRSVTSRHAAGRVLAGAAIAILALASSVAAPTSARALEASTKVYPLPQGSGPHDVAPAPDGKVWYTAQRQGALGILDPQTGAVRQVPLGSGSRPHGVIQGPDGAAWITDGGQNAIVRFDPATEQVKVWKLPADAASANLNTGTFDRDGIHWFTGQNGIYGRLDPRTGEMRVFRDPEGRGPYGIAATPDGTVYYVSLAGSHLARIDAATGEATVIEPPTEDQGARRVWSDSKGGLWISEWNSGQLSRFEPATGAWKTWKLPGDNPTAYAVYVDERDIVWVSDFTANAVLSFDPTQERFTAAYPGSAEAANVRQILGRPGEVWLPESGTDRLMLVRTDD